MKKPLIYLFILLSGFAHAQTDTLKQSKDTIIDGERYTHVDYFKDGKLKSIGNFDSTGTRIGKWWFYAANGNLKMSGRFKNGRKDGPWFVPPHTLEYYKMGQLTMKKKIDPGSTW